ncbi:MAG: class I SAM-dependent methyltransferase [Pseudomonadota bacterium]
MTSHCILCSGTQVSLFNQVIDVGIDNKKNYFSCEECQLIFLDQQHWTSTQQEKVRYDLHQNRPECPGYREHLERLLLPLYPLINCHDLGLDYGCGPYPLLGQLFEAHGLTHPMKNYDPFYAPDTTVLNQKYHFVTCNEVAEHFRDPKEEWKKLTRMLLPRGLIGISTNWWQHQDSKKFSDWYYRRDPTHLCFYRMATLKYLADKFSLEIVVAEHPIIIFQKKV